VIRINHVTLPEGLSCFARRNPDGEFDVFVSRTLSADRQRAAVRLALTASRRAGWRALLPVPAAGLLAGFRGWLGRLGGIGRVLRLHPVASAASTAVVVAGAVVAATVLPHPHGRISSGELRPPATGAPAPAPGSGHSSTGAPSTGSPRSRQHGQASETQPTPGTTEKASPAPGHSTGPAPTHGSAPAPSESPQPTESESSSPVTTQPSPTPAPSSQPSPTPTSKGGGKDCIKLLGVTVCL
jgi:hypothetical protein